MRSVLRCMPSVVPSVILSGVPFVVACATSGTGGAGGTGGDGGGGGFGASGGAPPICTCEPGVHTQRIAVLSDDGAIWTYDPGANEFALQRDIPCGVNTPFSMAVDATGTAWILDYESKDIVTLPLEGTEGCGDPGYDPGPLQNGFGLFGMAFSARGDGDVCADLFVHSYSGDGPFDEGTGVGALGKLDPTDVRFDVVAAIDYDGGELAGTGDGRLFAFAGANPTKLVEYDRDTGAPISTRYLDGLEKTNASAFAVFGGKVYFFTEAPPQGCDACLVQNCDAEYQACLADPPCAESLACALVQSEITDECGGLLSQALMSCVGGTCVDECLPNAIDKVSQVSRLDLADPMAALEIVHPAGPIRVVGAGTSICVPVVPN